MKFEFVNLWNLYNPKSACLTLFEVDYDFEDWGYITITLFNFAISIYKIK